ncbi:MAG: hypothetical protein COA71_02900 [SAR86 cluster bacterium]|uniref:Spore coat protein CotH n=1 Tax=SAR86 cluster bacterium TaxID=2030880 RepID=A0A2A5CIX7_9GAMM|nr:CotH kinase family protein [Gammaproteobacteria bacterium AH-315-E17]PCJ41794.1 MAG: hypothetical protein COA71_07220 [SAR86 cluster bacterium]PCJ43829.1 MAG: hypothetical protein COA71_02900 [SAR86 cluster bacterium]
MSFNIKPVYLLILTIMLLATLPALAQFGGFFGGGSDDQVALVDRFDDDDNGVLNAAERLQARNYLAGQPASSRSGRRWRNRTGNGSPGDQISQSEVGNFQNFPLYDTSVIRTVFLQFDNGDWEAELEAFHGTDVQVPVTAIVDGETYQDVGVRFRGNSSYSMVPSGMKRPLRLKFDLLHEEQNLYGYRTLNLLNSNNDPSFLRTILFSTIANNYLPTPQLGLFRLVINGENWGIYPHQQQFNRDFVEEFFSAEGGVRWKVPGSPRARGGMEYWGDDIDDYRDTYEIDNRDNQANWAALVNLFRVLDQTPLNQLEAALNPILNIDGVLRFLALDVALANSDGYWTRASDYYIFLDADERFHVLPHDFNEVMSAEGGRRSGNNLRLDPLVGLNDATKPLRSRLLAVPALRERYLAYVRDIAENWMDWDVIGPVATDIHEMITDDVNRDTRKLYSSLSFEQSLDGGAGSLQHFFEERRAYLLSEIPAI